MTQIQLNSMLVTSNDKVTLHSRHFKLLPGVTFQGFHANNADQIYLHSAVDVRTITTQTSIYVVSLRIDPEVLLYYLGSPFSHLVISTTFRYWLESVLHMLLSAAHFWPMWTVCLSWHTQSHFYCERSEQSSVPRQTKPNFSACDLQDHCLGPGLGRSMNTVNEQI